MKERNVVLHALAELPTKYENVAGLIKFSKRFPSFAEMCVMLFVEETRLSSLRVINPSDDIHGSSPTLLPVGALNNNRGGG